MSLRDLAAAWPVVEPDDGPVFVWDNKSYHDSVDDALEDWWDYYCTDEDEPEMPIVQPCDPVSQPTPDFVGLLAKHWRTGRTPAKVAEFLVDELVEAWSYEEDDGTWHEHPAPRVAALVREVVEAACEATSTDAEAILAGLHDLLVERAPVAWWPRHGARLDVTSAWRQLLNDRDGER